MQRNKIVFRRYFNSTLIIWLLMISFAIIAGLLWIALRYNTQYDLIPPQFTTICPQLYKLFTGCSIILFVIFLGLLHRLDSLESELNILTRARACQKESSLENLEQNVLQESTIGRFSGMHTLFMVLVLIFLIIITLSKDILLQHSIFPNRLMETGIQFCAFWAFAELICLTYIAYSMMLITLAIHEAQKIRILDVKETRISISYVFMKSLLGVFGIAVILGRWVLFTPFVISNSTLPSFDPFLWGAKGAAGMGIFFTQTDWVGIVYLCYHIIKLILLENKEYTYKVKKILNDPKEKIITQQIFLTFLLGMSLICLLLFKGKFLGHPSHFVLEQSLEALGGNGFCLILVGFDCIWLSIFLFILIKLTYLIMKNRKSRRIKGENSLTFNIHIIATFFGGLLIGILNLSLDFVIYDSSFIPKNYIQTGEKFTIFFGFTNYLLLFLLMYSLILLAVIVEEIRTKNLGTSFVKQQENFSRTKSKLEQEIAIFTKHIFFAFYLGIPFTLIVTGMWLLLYYHRVPASFLDTGGQLCFFLALQVFVGFSYIVYSLVVHRQMQKDIKKAEVEKSLPKQETKSPPKLTP